MKPVVDSTEAALEAFSTVCERLEGFGVPASAEFSDGLLTAAATGLTVPPLADIVAVLAGDDFDRVFADPEDRAQAERAIADRLVVLRGLLDAESLDERPDELRLSPLMEPWTDDERARLVADGVPADEAKQMVTGASWAHGFFVGLEAFATHWPPAASGDDGELLQNLVQQVHALRLPEDDAGFRQHLHIVYGEKGADRDQLIDSACFAIQDLRLWCVDHAPRPETRRVDTAPGRNDPCPCGSGKKFKKCHGAA